MDLLNGLQVLDLADEKASFCSKLLADLGARVIKNRETGWGSLSRDRPISGRVSKSEKEFVFLS